MEPARLAQPPRPWLAKPGRDGDHGRVRLVADDLEVVPLAHRRLVDVAREDEIGACVQQRTQHVVAARDRPLARRAPRRADQMVVEDGHAQRPRLGRGEPFRRALELRPAQRAALMAERPGRVEPDDVQAGRRRRRLGRLPDPLERRPRAHEASRRVREVVVAGHGEHRRPERAQQLRRTLELLGAPPVREIARSDDELRVEPLHQPRQRLLDLALLMCTRVQVGNMEEPRVHNRTRL